MAIIRTLSKERETKGTIVYTDEEEGDGALKGLYLPRTLVKELGEPAPRRITVMLEVVD